MMTARERVMAAIAHEQPDRAPYHVDFTFRAHQAMARYYGDEAFAGRIGNCLACAGAAPPDAWREVEPNIWEDQFGVRWDRSVDRDIGVVCNQIVRPANVDDFPLPDPAHPHRFDDLAETIATRCDRFVICNLGFSLYERAWTLAGMENLLMAMVADPAFAHRLLDRILAYNLAVIRRACDYHIDAMMFGDDWGQQSGVVMGARMWREFIKPRVREMYQTVKECGKLVFIHSCGKVGELFPDLIECGVDVFNPFQPEVIDVYEAKRAFGDRLTFFGGISTQRLLPYGTPDEVRAEVRRLLREVGANGGLIAAPAHATPGDARPENVAAMIEVLRDGG
jgi:uroporphyrinogen decarboxylase